MFQAYFEVFYSLLVGHTFRTLKIHHLLALRYSYYFDSSHQSEILPSLIFYFYFLEKNEPKICCYLKTRKVANKNNNDSLMLVKNYLVYSPFIDEKLLIAEPKLTRCKQIFQWVSFWSRGGGDFYICFIFNISIYEQHPIGITFRGKTPGGNILMIYSGS